MLILVLPAAHVKNTTNDADGAWDHREPHRRSTVTAQLRPNVCTRTSHPGCVGQYNDERRSGLAAPDQPSM